MFYIINKEQKKRLDNLKKFENVNLNFEILKHAGPEFIKEVVKNIQFLQNDLIRKSTKVRDINGLAYYDGASDFADKLKFELTQLINKLVVDPNTYNPVTGKKLTEKKLKKK